MTWKWGYRWYSEAARQAASNIEQRDRIRDAIRTWHVAREAQGDCVASGEGQLCCSDGVEDASLSGERSAGLDDLVDAIMEALTTQ